MQRSGELHCGHRKLPDCRRRLDGLYAKLAAAAVLHPDDPGSAVGTAWGTREFAALDNEGNLLTFWASTL